MCRTLYYQQPNFLRSSERSRPILHTTVIKDIVKDRVWISGRFVKSDLCLAPNDSTTQSFERHRYCSYDSRREYVARDVLSRQRSLFPSLKVVECKINRRNCRVYQVGMPPPLK